MFKRFSLWFLSSFTLISLTGCGEDVEITPISYTEYPVRDDYLVMETPKVAATKWYEPGMPPLASLDLPLDRLDADQKAFRDELTFRRIRNTRKMAPSDRTDLQAELTKYFGTPIAPKIEYVSDDIKKACEQLLLDPATLSRGSQVYQNYCATCHGLTGNGNGPGSRFLQPLPRDYRQGVFKFVSVEPGNTTLKPRREDLYKTVRHGLMGSAMPAFGSLSEDDIQAVVSHVIFLSIRGEAEYQILRIYTDDPEGVAFKDDITATIKKLIPQWLANNSTPLHADTDSTGVSLYTGMMLEKHLANAMKTLWMKRSDDAATMDKFIASAADGHKLFTGEAGCVSCHIGYGKNAPYQYDSWASIVRPRNLYFAVMRGGRTPEAIYARLVDGIQGSGMPSHKHLLPTIEDKQKGVHKIWSLVHFVLAMGENATRSKLEVKLGQPIE
jgi:cytochrome c5